MPHTQRKRSESGFYHVVAKGDGAQIIFEDNSDRRLYVDILAKTIDEFKIKLHAYCLMSNHVHLLVQDEQRELSGFMKKLSETYAMHFSRKTGRVGRVFQRPFWSEPVESDAYFLCALRYIHANPEPAGICKAKDYPWSSYQDYLSGSAFVEVEFARELLGGIRRFEEFSASGGSYAKPFTDSKLSRHHNSDELVNIAINLLGRETLNNLRAMSPEARKPHIALLHAHGFTKAEIARITGLGSALVGKALSN